MKASNLENRLIDFSVGIIQLVKSLNNSLAGQTLSKQVIRSGTSVSLNYGEAQSGESRRDFIHKMKLVMKELRETYVCLQIIDKAKLHKAQADINVLLKENNELIAIFVKSILTAQKTR